MDAIGHARFIAGSMTWGSVVSGDGRRQAFVGGVCRGCYKWKLQADQRGRAQHSSMFIMKYLQFA